MRNLVAPVTEELAWPGFDGAGEVVAADARFASPAAQRALGSAFASTPAGKALIGAVADALQESGIALVGQVPVEDDRALVAFAAALGPVESAGNEGTGLLVSEIRFRGEQAGPLSARASEFPPHTDLAFTGVECGVVLMGCVRHDPGSGGANTLIPLRPILARLTESALTLLAEPLYRQQSTHGGTGSYQRILFADSGGTRIQFRHDHRNWVAAHPDRPDAAAALAALRTALAHDEVPAFGLLLRAGQVIVFDNTRYLHARDAYAPHADRWLRRVRVARLEPRWA
jgi:hypothetical protein